MPGLPRHAGHAARPRGVHGVGLAAEHGVGAGRAPDPVVVAHEDGRAFLSGLLEQLTAGHDASGRSAERTVSVGNAPVHVSEITLGAATPPASDAASRDRACA